MPHRETELMPFPPATGAKQLDADNTTIRNDSTETSAPDTLAIARLCLDDMKAEETVEIDLTGKTSIADAMIITSGRSQRHVGSIADRVVEALKAAGVGQVRVEGMTTCDWVLIDAGDLIVHIFRPEVRGFYNLEKMWGASRPAEQERLVG